MTSGPPASCRRFAHRVCSGPVWSLVAAAIDGRSGLSPPSSKPQNRLTCGLEDSSAGAFRGREGSAGGLAPGCGLARDVVRLLAIGPDCGLDVEIGVACRRCNQLAGLNWGRHRRSSVSSRGALTEQMEVGLARDRAGVRSYYRHRIASVHSLEGRLPRPLGVRYWPNLNPATFRKPELWPESSGE